MFFLSNSIHNRSKYIKSRGVHVRFLTLVGMTLIISNATASYIFSRGLIRESYRNYIFYMLRIPVMHEVSCTYNKIVTYGNHEALLVLS